jgi:hypothetical protein
MSCVGNSWTDVDERANEGSEAPRRRRRRRFLRRTVGLEVEIRDQFRFDGLGKRADLEAEDDQRSQLTHVLEEDRRGAAVSAELDVATGQRVGNGQPNGDLRIRGRLGGSCGQRERTQLLA